MVSRFTSAFQVTLCGKLAYLSLVELKLEGRGGNWRPFQRFQGTIGAARLTFQGKQGY